MGRRAKKQLEVSLFPFLSILACVIGILVLILCSVVIFQIDPEGIEEVKKERERQLALQKRLIELESEKTKVQEDIDRMNDLLSQKTNLKAKIEVADQKIAKAEKTRQDLIDKKAKLEHVFQRFSRKMTTFILPQFVELPPHELIEGYHYIFFCIEIRLSISR